jgi:hypothetical protein
VEPAYAVLYVEQMAELERDALGTTDQENIKRYLGRIHHANADVVSRQPSRHTLAVAILQLRFYDGVVRNLAASMLDQWHERGSDRWVFRFMKDDAPA